MKRSFNYTGRIKLADGTVPITMVEEAGIPSFEADTMGLAELGLDNKFRVVLEPYVGSTTMRFDFGTLGQLKCPDDLRLSDLDDGSSVRFRLKIIDDSVDPSRIVAFGKMTTGDSPDDERSRSILHLNETATLGQRLWKLDAGGDDTPELSINSNIPGFKGRLLSDPLIQGLILPAVVRELLFELLQGSASDDLSWVSSWKKFAEGMAGRKWPSEEDGEEFIEDCVVAFCAKYEFQNRVIAVMKGKDDE
jgi:hypothetical protein